MPKANVCKAQAYHHVMLYGPPKSGKTRAAVELAKHYNLIWIDNENGFGTAYSKGVGLTDENLGHVTLLSLRDNSIYPIAAETIFKLLSPTLWNHEVSVCAAHGKVECLKCKNDNAEVDMVALAKSGRDTIVVVDSLTQLAMSALCVAKGGRAKLPTGLKVLTGQVDPATSYVKAEFDTWASQGDVLNNILSAIQTAPFHIIVISHEMELEMEGGAERLVPAGGTRNYSRSVGKFFDHILLAGVKAGKHVAGSSTLYRPNALTGSRSGVVTESLPAEQALLAIFDEYRNYKPV